MRPRLPPMDVAVDGNRGRRPRLAVKLSFMGEGLLDRARSTTLALLGGVAAIGLVAVGLALNQGWPLLPDSPLPAERPVVSKPDGKGGPTGEDAVSSATAPSAKRAPARGPSDAEPGSSGGAASGPVAPGGGGESVATSSPVSSTPSGETGGGGKPPSRPAQKPRGTASPKPVAQPVSNPSPPRQSQSDSTEAESEPEPEPDTATTSGAPETGNAWGWDNGQARGHDRDHGWDRGADDHGWDRDDDGRHGGGWGHGHDHGH